MDLLESDISLISEALPELELFPEFAEMIEEELRRRLFLTAAFLQLAVFQNGPLAGLPARTREVTFGFIPLGPDLEYTGGFRERFICGERFTFGVSVHADLRTDEPEFRQLLLDNPINLSGMDFPVVVTYSRLNREALPPNPDHPTTIASSTGWVRSTGADASWDFGIMTARHVVEHLSSGSLVDLDVSGTPYTAPTDGTIADPGDCQIDAAIIEIDSSDWPTSVSPMNLAGPFLVPIAPGDDVTLDGRIASSVSGRTLSHHPLPHYWGSLMGQRLVIDSHGQGGDSGGLVTHVPSGAGIGLYIGRINDGAGGENGLCQDLYQASIFLEAELYI